MRILQNIRLFGKMMQRWRPEIAEENNYFNLLIQVNYVWWSFRRIKTHSCISKACSTRIVSWRHEWTLKKRTPSGARCVVVSSIRRKCWTFTNKVPSMWKKSKRTTKLWKWKKTTLLKSKTIIKTKKITSKLILIFIWFPKLIQFLKKSYLLMFL